MDPAVDVALRTALALLWLAAAGHKLRSLGRFRVTLADYRLVPERLVPIAVVVVVAVEVTIAALLVAPGMRTAGALATALLLTGYGAAIGVNLARGRWHIDCGCVGPAARRSLSGWLVARNGALAAVALVGLVPVHARPMLWVDGLTVAATTLVLAILYAAADGLIANAPAFARLRGEA